MSIANVELQSLPHAVFLHRASDRPDGKGLHSRLGQGAFLALRLIDQLAPEQDAVSEDVFDYQCTATERFCSDLRRAATEGAHLHGLVKGAAEAYRHADLTLLAPDLFAYAHYLEETLSLEEALDVLGTLRRIVGEHLSASDSVALSLRTGRVNRKLSRFDDAEQAYSDASERARAAGDTYSELLSRIGRANTVLGRGNMPEAQRRLTEILADARRENQRDAEARAEHGIAAVLQLRGSPDDALSHMWRAFELYEDEDSRMRALSDVGVMMLTLGDTEGAERALNEVVRRGVGMQDTVANATIELMHSASFRRDRVTFERFRARCEEMKAKMPPNILADYHLKVGIGEARFGRFRRATATLARALEVAENARLHSFVFKIERIKGGLPACEAMFEAGVLGEGAPRVISEALDHVSASLAELVGEPS